MQVKNIELYKKMTELQEAYQLEGMSFNNAKRKALKVVANLMLKGKI